MFDVLSELEDIGRPTIRRKPWMDQKKLSLATKETLPQIIDECIASKLYALDLETTGLDSRVFNGCTIDKIAGACVSPDGEKGYYIPVLHPQFMDSCIPFSMFVSEMRRLVASGAIAIFHNGKFDQEFLQFNGSQAIGEWDDPRKWEDTLVLAYMRNTRERNKGLKHLSKVELQMEMIELEELFPEKAVKEGRLDFGTLDPCWEAAILYAASDAICTYLLYHKLKDVALKPTEDGLPSQEPVYVIEKLCVAATRWMERNRIPIDRGIVADLIRVGQREWLPALSDVYTESSKALGRDVMPGYVRLLMGTDTRFKFDPEDVEEGIKDKLERTRAEADRQNMDPMEIDSRGKPRVKTIQKRVPNLLDKKLLDNVDFPLVYDILSPDQLGLILRELGVQGLAVTEKSGQIKTSKDELDRVLEEAGEDFPYIKKVKRFREVAKAIASNLRPIYDATSKELSPDGRIRINFEGFKTDTARFSTPQDSEDRGWTGKARWNLHSVPATYDPSRPECMGRMREVIRVKEGKILFCIDFSGEELRVVTNLSGEPLWVKEFFRCSGCGHEFDRGQTVPPPPEPPPPFCPECKSDKIGDLHTLTAQAIFGKDVMSTPEGKHKRGQSKAVNFALCYGGGGSAVVRAAGCSKDEGWRIKRQFDGTYKGLAAWWVKQHEFARRTKHVLTAFNRRYPVPDIDSADGGFRSKAERNAVNAPIQASGSDLMKYAMGLIYREFKKRGWLDKVKMIITIHDELVFECEKELLQEAVPVITEIMLKKTVAKLSWRVPLTCDVEAGMDWTVPWNLTKIMHGKQKVPPELEGVWGPSSEAHVEHKEPETNSQSPKVAESVPMTAQYTAPELAQGEPYVHVIKIDERTMLNMSKLARVIVSCRGRGTHPLKIVTETGEPLWEGGDILVNPLEIQIKLNTPEI